MKALIIGGGIAGPAVAMFLRRAGIEAVIYEAQPDPMDNTGLFMNLAVNGMSVLNLLGVESRVRAYGTPATGITLYNSSGKSIGRVDNSHEKQRYGLTNVMIKRGLLHRALREAALEQGIQIEYGKKLIRIEEQGVAHFEDGTQAQGDFLIGCDGLHSRTRRIMLPDAPQPEYTGLIDCGGFAYLPSITPSSDQQMIFGKKAFFGYFTAPDGEIFWFSNLAANEPARGEWKQKLLDLYANDLPLISEIIQATKGDIRAWAIHDFPSLPTWHKGRICLVGDAAHATSPHIGQGASLALEDAAVLARCLRDIPKLERAFSTYEHLRKARVEKLIQQARRTGNQKAVSNPVMGWIRDLMLPFFIKMGAKSMEWVYSYRVDWDSKVA